MKILVVIPDLNLGGVTSSVLNFCKECIRRGDAVDLVVMDNAEAHLKNVYQIRLEGRAALWNLNAAKVTQFKGLSKYRMYILGAIKKISNHLGLWLPFIFKGITVNCEYDLAIGYRQCAPCYYFTLNCVHAKTKIAMIHGNLNFMETTRSWNKYLPEFNKIACVSKAVSLDFKIQFPLIKDKFTTIYNMFDVKKIIAMSSMPCDFKIDDSLFNIISVTRHENDHKKTNRIIEACFELKRRGVKDFHWYIVGDGPDFINNVRLATRLRVSDLITFCGALSNPYALQSKCNLSVLTSATEAYSMTVIESQILNKPIIAMEYAGITEAIKNGETGIICEQTISSLCDSIVDVMCNNELLSRISSRLAQLPVNNDLAYLQLIEASN